MKIPTSPFQGEVKIGEALRLAAKELTQTQTPQLDARILLRHALSLDDAGLIAHANDPMPPAGADHYAALIARREKGEPVAYLTGVKEFWSLPFKVTPDVLIPRDDSGALIEAALARRGRDEPLRIVDLGTGSGCLLCALLSEFPNSEGVGVDASEAALAVARENAAALGLAGRARFLAGDWLQPLSGAFDIVIANPPYIPEGDRPGLARDVAGYEPSSALFAGADGLDAYRAILGGLAARLSKEALVLMECGSDQVAPLSAMLARLAPEKALFTMADLAGRPRGAGIDLRKTEKRD
ncbi:peptide chain release factor N(5)-glutamine methyltransferase [Hyphococcus luteus]|nr:peptide chain release factor N(5)-glutamine methyltransferase [Marinicaulis flavus]